MNSSTPRSVIERAREWMANSRHHRGCGVGLDAPCGCEKYTIAAELDALLREPTVTRERVEALPDIFVDVALIQFLPDGRYFRRDDVLALFATRTEEPKR